MDKQKQIEEMQSIIAKSISDYLEEEGVTALHIKGRKEGTSTKIISNALYNAGYRKIPENSVVLTEEEYKKLKHGSGTLEKLYEQYPYRVLVGFNSMVFSQDRESYEKLYDEIEKKASKETAEKFAEMLKAKLTDIIPFEDYEVADWNYDGIDIENSIDEICKELTESK